MCALFNGNFGKWDVCYCINIYQECWWWLLRNGFDTVCLCVDAQIVLQPSCFTTHRLDVSPLADTDEIATYAGYPDQTSASADVTLLLPLDIHRVLAGITTICEGGGGGGRLLIQLHSLDTLMMKVSRVATGQSLEEGCSSSLVF